MFKIVRKSNFDHEDHRGDQWVAAASIPTERIAKVMCEALNNHEHEHSDDFFAVVPQSYVLPPPWSP